MPPLSNTLTFFNEQDHHVHAGHFIENGFTCNDIEGRNPRNIRKRSVVFSGFPSINKVYTIPVWSDDELRQTWMCDEDYKRSKQECAYTLQVLLKGGGGTGSCQRRGGNVDHHPQNELCRRGLENMTRAAMLQSKSRKQYSRKVVLEEQQRQRQEGITNIEQLASLYTTSASRCTMAAIAVGKMDATDALATSS